MANLEQLILLMQGVSTWNPWIEEHSQTPIDLSGANLSNANLCGVSLYRANLARANLNKTDLSGADLYGADLTEASLRGADLSGADLGRANLTDADLSEADLTGCFVYGTSAWDVKLENTTQANLIITRLWQPAITVDNLEVAQFIYLLLNNKKIRDVIDIITSKVVLILGRFTSERKVVLETIRDELRTRNYTPVLFDFEKPASRDLTETVSTLAHLARFIIVDLTKPRQRILGLPTF